MAARNKGGAAVKAMRTTLSRAVVEKRAPEKTLSETAAEALFRGLDYFPTPPWAARAIAHRVKELDPGSVSVWEPCCGEGHFAEPLREVFGESRVLASDIYDYGYGATCDFFHFPFERLTVDWIITNPPFSLGEPFVQRALIAAQRGVIVLCRVAFLESVDRYDMLYEGPNRLTTLMPFAERVPMQLGSWDPDLSSATAYAAFVFHKGRNALPPMPFRPGTKRTYWRDTDPARFAKPAPIPLFENVASAPLFATGAP
mgnify:CR=1 FL=1